MTVHRIVPLILPKTVWKNALVPESTSLKACPIEWIRVPVAFPTPVIRSWLNVPNLQIRVLTLLPTALIIVLPP